MAVIPGTYGIKVGNLGAGQAKTAVGIYNFATLGGAVSTIALTGDAIPTGAVITDALLLVDTLPTSGGLATITVGTEGAADIQASVAFNAAPFASTGAKRASLTATSAPVVTTAARPITITIGTAALTAGKCRVVVTYLDAPA